MARTTPVPVTADNFVRAESDMYFTNIVKDGGFGKFHHNREPAPVDRQPVIRLNRDTIYSSGVFDLDAGPVTVTLPEAGSRFMSMQVINEDQYALTVAYGGGTRTYTKEVVGTRYVLLGVRTFLDPNDPADLKRVHALQNAIKVEQPGVGRFETPAWDMESQKKVHDALLTLGETLPDSRHMFGDRDHVDPVRHLIGAAMAWGGNPEKDAVYLIVTPKRNDGQTVHRLSVKDVPVEAFWSISVYNREGYFEPNPQNAYSLNNVTAKQDGDGSVTVQFGGCDGDAANCLPITPGWNYIVRLYRPKPEILTGRWTFPEAQAVQ